VHELIERFDGHLKAEEFYSVIANMRGESPDQVASVLINARGLMGLAVRGGAALCGSCLSRIHVWVCLVPYLYNFLV
jgi:hypothetical protein